MKLEEICHFIVDCPHSTAEDEGVGYPLIRTPNIGKGCFILEGVHRVSEEVYNIRNKRAIPQDDDLIFAREAPAGNVAIIKNGEKYCLGQRTVLIRPNKDVVDPDFLTYYLLAPQQQHNLLKTENGSTASHVNMPIIRGLEIVLPKDKAIQQKIGCVLSEYDELIAINRKKIQVLEEMAMRTYREWFVHMRFPGHETTPIKDGLPEGWKYEQLNNFLKFERGLSYTSEEIASNEGELLINLKNIVAYGGYNYNGSKYYSGDYKSRYIIKGGDLVMGVTDMTQDRRTVGAVALIPFSINRGVISADLVKLKSKLPNCYLYGLFRYGNLSSHISEFANGSNVLHLKPDSIQKQIVKLPTKELIDKYSLLIEPILQQIDMINLKNSDLQQMRDKLLPQLMSGKFKVKP